MKINLKGFIIKYSSLFDFLNPAKDQVDVLVYTHDHCNLVLTGVR